jgi:serine/threonine-protein kinase
MGVHSWTVPGYTDVREFGRTTRGRAVLARHAATGAPVTIRYLADDLRGDEAFLTGYRTAARALAEVESPYVAELYEYVESDDGIATVREYIDGGSVRHLIPSSGMHPEAALSVLNAGLQGLAAIRAAGGTHGAYKPENLLVGRDGSTKLADFAADAGRDPEQAAGDGAEDISAALTTFLECLLGSRAARRIDRRTLDRLPNRLRVLVSAAANNDGSAVVTDLTASARATYGDEWETSARARLAQQPSRLRRSG